MPNVLKVSHQESIRSLYEKGWSERRIARELGVNRRTVKRYTSKCTTLSTPGFFEGAGSKCTTATPGSGNMDQAKPAVSTFGKSGSRKSLCEPFESVIMAKLELGLTGQRIYQDLLEETGFSGSYQAVKRFVGKLRQTQPERVFRMECQPGEEMQVDFGLGAPIEDLQTGKTRRSWVFRAVLSFSERGHFGKGSVLSIDTPGFPLLKRKGKGKGKGSVLSIDTPGFPLLKKSV